MAKYKVYLPKQRDMLPVYAEAANGQTAIKKVEKLLGPLKGVKAEEVEKVPEGETVL